MSDLISRSELLEKIDSYIYDTVNPEKRRMERIVKALFIELIEKQPTAFDLDKVIAELEKLSIEELGVSESQFEMDKGEYSSYCTLCLYDVVELLKKHLTGTAEPPKTD